MTIKGASFTGATVKLDRNAIAPLSLADSEISLRMPAHDNGYAILAIENGTRAAYGRYLFVPPSLSEIAPGFITTVAGVGSYAGDYTAATAATIDPMTVAFFDGETYVAQPGANRVSRITRDGLRVPFAGNGFSNDPMPPPAQPVDPLSVAINFPRAIAFDSRGNGFIGDSSYRLLRVNRATGLIETIAGTGRDGNSPEGVAAKGAVIGLVSFVAAEPDGTVYFIDFTNARVRKISTDGILTTYIGTGTFGFSGDGGPAAQAQFSLQNSDEGALALDSDGNLYLADTANNRIRRVEKRTGIITSLSDTSFQGTALREPRGVAASADGGIAFTSGPQIFEYRNGEIVRRYGSSQGFSEPGTPLESVRFSFTPAVAFDPQGNVVASDVFNHRVWRLNRTTERLETIAGIGPAILNERGRAIEAVLAINNGDVAIANDGSIYLADTANSRVRRIDPAGNIDTIVATFDGPAPASTRDGTFGGWSVEAAADGSFDFATLDSSYVLTADRVVRRTAGSGSPKCGFSGDGGPALAADFCQSWDVTRNPSGNLVVADTNNNRVRLVDRTSGIIRTFAGSGAVNGNEGYGHGPTCGDGGPATSACVNTPYGVAYDDRGNLYISENGERIRKVDTTGVISTFATGRSSKLTFWRGNLYTVTGTQLLRFSADGTPTVLAGDGSLGFAGDGGPATSAKLFMLKQSAGIAIDPEGNLYFTDGDNLRVRAIRYGAVLAPPNASISAIANGSAIRVTVRDANGGPAASVRVDFTAPASGSSCALSSSFAITGADGIASVSCAPNCIAGTYSVTARPLTAASAASVSFNNSARPCKRRSVHR